MRLCILRGGKRVWGIFANIPAPYLEINIYASPFRKEGDFWIPLFRGMTKRREIKNISLK